MSGPSSIDRETLGKRLARREFWGQFFGWMVGVGLVVEYWNEIVACFVKWELPPWPLVGGLLVTLGVFGEVWFSRLVTKTAEEIQERADSDVALANERAAKALEQAAEANRLAESERLARVKIEERLRPRRFDKAGRNEMIRALSPFKGQRGGIRVASQEEEAQDFSEELSSIFLAAGWSMFNPEPWISSVPVPRMRGCGIFLSSQAPSPSGAALFEALRGLNIAVDPPAKFGNVAPNEVVVMVGAKP